MSRRYLSQSEVQNALNRGKSVECFLGYCSRGGRDGVRWLSLSSNKNTIKICLFETADLGSEDYLDLYEFGPLNEELELEDPDMEIEFSDLSKTYDWLNSNYSSATFRLVNQFVIQEEYHEYIINGRSKVNA
jgi:hypothetical protein